MPGEAVQTTGLRRKFHPRGAKACENGFVADGREFLAFGSDVGPQAVFLRVMDPGANALPLRAIAPEAPQTTAACRVSGETFGPPAMSTAAKASAMSSGPAEGLVASDRICR